MLHSKNVTFVCGATASGKTSYALDLAKKTDAEIVNADAFQLYRGLETISAAPSQDELEAAPHHLFGILETHEKCDAGLYAAMANKTISEIHSHSKHVIVVGGSGLYLKFLTHGASPLPQADLALRAKMQTRSLDDLFTELQSLDPAEAAQVDRHNPRYVSRALEICLLSGQKASEMRDSWEQKTREIESSLQGVWLIRNREILHERIAQRTKNMLRDGAIEEVAALRETSGNSIKAIGIAEIRRYLGGEISLSECEELITIATRQYAKRQETWFRREKWLRAVTL
jgi:tRNA dimethylallyltransferase